MAKTPTIEAEPQEMESRPTHYQMVIFDPAIILPITPAGIAGTLAGVGPLPGMFTHPYPIPPLGPAERPPPPAAIAHDLIARFPRPVELVSVDFILEPVAGSLPPPGPGWRTYPYGAHVFYIKIHA
jgi:hypothetical protein